MKNQQVGDASVLIEGEAERRFGLTARLGVAVHPINSIDVPAKTINVPIDTINSIRDRISCKSSMH